MQYLQYNMSIQDNYSDYSLIPLETMLLESCLAFSFIMVKQKLLIVE